MEVFFEQMHPDDLKPEHIALIQSSEAFETTEEEYDVFEMIADKKAQVWLYQDSDGGNGILITTILVNSVKGNKELCLWRLYGNKILRSIKQHVYPRMIEFADLNDCTVMYALITAPGMENYLTRVLDFTVSTRTPQGTVVERML